MHLSLLLLSGSYFVLSCQAFTFYFTSAPTQCANTTVQWTGGQAPFTLLLVPVGHLNPETRTIIQKDVPSGGSVSFVLDFPAKSQFVTVLNDGSGIGTGGTSAITTVASSSDSSCLSTTQSEAKFFLFLPGDIGECDSTGISWGSEAQEPVDVLGLIPGGESFEIANVTDSSTSCEWTADVRSGTQIMFVAGDKDGLGTGGSSDVLQVSEGDGDSCINDSSPSSTTGLVAGGVSSATQDQGNIQTTGSGNGVGSTVTTRGVVTTEVNGPSSSSTGFPGSDGGTVTGSSHNSSRHGNLGLILGILFGLLAISMILIGIWLYRRHQKSNAYRNLETGRNHASARPHPWVSALTRGAHIRGGAGSSVDTLPSMYQTEPFFLPSEHEPYFLPPQEPLPIRQQRPNLLARASSSHSIHTLLGEEPFARDAFDGTLAGMHEPDRKDSIGPHGRPPSRTPSGRAVAQRGFPPPSSSEPPIRVTRDSEDFSSEPEETSQNPFDDAVVEIPPSYASVRRASRSND